MEDEANPPPVLVSHHAITYCERPSFKPGKIKRARLFSADFMARGYYHGSSPELFAPKDITQGLSVEGQPLILVDLRPGPLVAPGPGALAQDVAEIERKARIFWASTNRGDFDNRADAPFVYMSRDADGIPRPFMKFFAGRSSTGASSSAAGYSAEPEPTGAEAPPTSIEGEIRALCESMNQRPGAHEKTRCAVELVVQHGFFVRCPELQRVISRACTEDPRGRCWSDGREGQLQEYMNMKEFMGKDFEFPLVEFYVGLVPAPSQRIMMRDRFGDPTTSSGWEGTADHRLMKVEKYEHVVGDDLKENVEQWNTPSSQQYHSRRNIKYLMQFCLPGAVRSPASFSEVRFLKPVRGMLTQVPTLDALFSDAPDDSVRYKTVADLLDFGSAVFHRNIVGVKGSREDVDISHWEIPLVTLRITADPQVSDGERDLPREQRHTSMHTRVGRDDRRQRNHFTGRCRRIVGGSGCARVHRGDREDEDRILWEVLGGFSGYICHFLCPRRRPG